MYKLFFTSARGNPRSWLPTIAHPDRPPRPKPLRHFRRRGRPAISPALATLLRRLQYGDAAVVPMYRTGNGHRASDGAAGRACRTKRSAGGDTVELAVRHFEHGPPIDYLASHRLPLLKSQKGAREESDHGPAAAQTAEHRGISALVSSEPPPNGKQCRANARK